VLENFAGGPAAFASVANNGTLAYFSGGSAPGTTLRWVERSGAVQALPGPAHIFGDLKLSPDGKTAAASIVDLEKLGADLWLYELDGERLTRLTYDGVNVAPTWTPDGRRLIFAHAKSFNTADAEIRAVDVDSSALPVTLAALPGGGNVQPTSISPDGKTLIGAQAHGGGSNDVWTMQLFDASSDVGGNSGPTLTPLLDTSFDERDAVLSPDGRFLAYTSNESGRDEVYVIPYPGRGRTQVSSGGGKLPRWNPSGRELFFVNGVQLLAVDVDTAGTFRRLTPKVLFEAPELANPSSSMYSVAPDGSRFLMVSDSGQAVELRVVLNWFEELKRLAPAH
jgi:Tol biopolymer transport system component